MPKSDNYFRQMIVRCCATCPHSFLLSPIDYQKLATSEGEATNIRTMKKLRLLALLFLLIVLVAANEDEICHDGECYPRIFVPTEEFQVIREGQEIPGGSSLTAISNLRTSRSNEYTSKLFKFRFLTQDWRKRSEIV